MLAAAELAKKPKEFLRTTGINYITFLLIEEKIAAYIAAQKQQHPLSQRGRKSKYSLRESLLLTLLYMRQYPTFLSLGQAFAISESYAYKRYCYIRGILLQVLDMPHLALLTSLALNQVVVDVSEQPIERPLQGQKAYYSGKKKAYDKGLAGGLPPDGLDPTGALRQRKRT